MEQNSSLTRVERWAFAAALNSQIDAPARTDLLLLPPADVIQDCLCLLNLKSNGRWGNTSTQASDQ